MSLTTAKRIQIVLKDAAVSTKGNCGATLSLTAKRMEEAVSRPDATKILQLIVQLSFVLSVDGSVDSPSTISNHADWRVMKPARKDRAADQ